MADCVRSKINDTDLEIPGFGSVRFSDMEYVFDVIVLVMDLNLVSRVLNWWKNVAGFITWMRATSSWLE